MEWREDPGIVGPHTGYQAGPRPVPWRRLAIAGILACAALLLATGTRAASNPPDTPKGKKYQIHDAINEAFGLFVTPSDLLYRTRPIAPSDEPHDGNAILDWSIAPTGALAGLKGNLHLNDGSVQIDWGAIDWEETAQRALGMFVQELAGYASGRLSPHRIGAKANPLLEAAILSNLTGQLRQAYLREIPAAHLATTLQALGHDAPEAKTLRWMRIMRESLNTVETALGGAAQKLYGRTSRPRLIKEALAAAAKVVDTPSPKRQARKQKRKRQASPQQIRAKTPPDELSVVRLAPKEKNLFSRLLQEFASSTDRLVAQITADPPKHSEHAALFVVGLEPADPFLLANPDLNVQFKIDVAADGKPSVRLTKVSIRPPGSVRQIEFSPKRGLGQLKRLDPETGKPTRVRQIQIGRTVLKSERSKATAATTKINRKLTKHFRN